MSLSDRLFCNHHAHPLRQTWAYRWRCAKKVSVGFKSRLNPWYILIPSNPNLCSTKRITKMWWQTIASNVSIRTISPTATPLPKAYDCIRPPTKKTEVALMKHFIYLYTPRCCHWYLTRWRHQMETFSALLDICAVPGEFPAHRRSFGVFFDLRLNKRLSKEIMRLVTWDAIAPIMTSL